MLYAIVGDVMDVVFTYFLILFIPEWDIWKPGD